MNIINILRKAKKMKERSLEYEKKFRKYLYSFDYETHKKICENINIKIANKKQENHEK